MCQPVHSPPLLFLGGSTYDCICHLSLACLRSSALTPLRPPASGEGKGSRERTMLKFYQMTGRGLARCGWAGRGNALCEGQEWCDKGSTTIPGPPCCILWAFSGVAPHRADKKFTAKLLSGGGRHRSWVTFALTWRCIPVQQPVRCQSTHSDHGAAASTIGHHKSCRICQSCCSKPSPILSSRTAPCAETMTHTSQTPTAGHALNQIFCYGL